MGDPFEGLFESGEVLERVAVNLTTQARRGDLEPVRCRDAEIARVVDILLRQSKNNPVLIGKAGVGKTAIVEGLAQRVAAVDVPPALKDARVVALDHVALLAGASTISGSAAIPRSNAASSRSGWRSSTRFRPGKCSWPGGPASSATTPSRSRTTRSRPRSSSPTGSFPSAPAPTRPSTCWT